MNDAANMTAELTDEQMRKYTALEIREAVSKLNHLLEAAGKLGLCVEISPFDVRLHAEAQIVQMQCRVMKVEYL